MKDLHRLLLQVLKDRTRPSNLLSHIIAAKMEEQGIENAVQYLDKIEAEIQAVLDERGADGLGFFQINTGDPEIDGRDIQLTLDQSDIEHMIHKASRVIDKIIPTTADDIAHVILRRIKRNAKNGLGERDLDRAAFEYRLWDRWGRALELLGLEIALACEAGGLANKWLRNHFRIKGAFVVEVLTRLHARACQVAGEVKSLLSAGYADGAVARWRTLHELSVVSWFIKDKGNDVAERYLLHSTIDSLRAAQQYNEFAPIVGYKALTQKELTTLERESCRLMQRFGGSFREEYGWASEALGKPRPRFADIESSADLRAFRPWYKSASCNVHAGPEGALFRLGLLQNAGPVLLAGPSNAGLDEAGRLTAISLAQVSTSLLLHRITFDSLVWSKMLLSLCGDVEHAFTKAQKLLVREERTLARQTQARKEARRKRKKPSNTV